MKKLLVIIVFLLVNKPLWAQTCAAPGQNPSTAFPVCGTSTFHQSNVPICSTHSIIVPGCSGTADGAAYGDKNPFWYKFTCYEPGSLGFLITPSDQGDDYDWQLYDITGHSPDDVFTNQSLVVTGNWAGTYGNTGTSASGVKYIQCASDPAENRNSFSAMPNLIKGHTYLLLVSHFTDSQSGYDLSFGGGSAVITDTTIPNLKTIAASCSADVLHLKINKHIKCNSVASDGSDFYITASNAAIINSTGVNCSTNFDTDSIELKLSQPLAPGNYVLHAKKGSDGNTLVDFCDNAMPVTDVLNFSILPNQPTPMDSLAPLSCAPQKLQLLFRKPILCSSIAANGSDFMVTGNYPVSISNAAGVCDGTTGTTKEIIITLSQPLQRAGKFTLTLQQGNDGNTLIDECGEQTPAGSNLSFSIKDTVNARFAYAIQYGCQSDVVNFSYPPQSGVDNWQWNLDDNMLSSQQNPQGTYTNFTTKHISLIANNGFCSDSSSATIVLDNYLKADFAVDQENCPQEAIPFTDNAQGKIVNYNWTFGDGGTASAPSPTHTYAQQSQSVVYTITYTVTDSFGCKSTVQKPIHIYSSCNINVPNAFTPNNDGKNDFLYPLNAVKAKNLHFKIYNRWGQLVFETTEWQHGWDGSFKGEAQPAGVYLWMLQYEDGLSQQPILRKGTAMLIR